jgi:hypothetical protein
MTKPFDNSSSFITLVLEFDPSTKLAAATVTGHSFWLLPPGIAKSDSGTDERLALRSSIFPQIVELIDKKVDLLAAKVVLRSSRTARNQGNLFISDRSPTTAPGSRRQEARVDCSSNRTSSFGNVCLFIQTMSFMSLVHTSQI